MMGELKILIWVILGIIYLISRARKKPTSEAPPTTSQENLPDGKPLTFEELLREIQMAKEPKLEPKAVLTPVPKYQPNKYHEEITEEAHPLEDTNYSSRDHDSIYETYEKAKQGAFLRPSLEETQHLENTIVKFGQFKGYEQVEKESLARDYARELADPKSFKKAFMLSEILNRRF